jgi:hypothetical protein
MREPLWNLLLAEIDRLDVSQQKELRLDRDSTFFWRFMYDEIEVVGNTRVRLEILNRLRHSLEFFGNFVEPHARNTLRTQYRINFRRTLDYFEELPLLFMNSDVIVDVVNLGYNTGVSPKIMGCLACGGLIIFDYKEDFRRSFGDISEQVMYHDVDHLNGLVDEYLTNGRKRRDVIRYLQQRVSTEFSFAALARRVLVDEPAWQG